MLCGVEYTNAEWETMDATRTHLKKHYAHTHHESLSNSTSMACFGNSTELNICSLFTPAVVNIWEEEDGEEEEVFPL